MAGASLLAAIGIIGYLCVRLARLKRANKRMADRAVFLRGARWGRTVPLAAAAHCSRK